MQPNQTTLERAFELAKSGEHDTVNLIKKKLKAEGYKFVTVSELVALGKPVIVSECYDRKPGDTKRYDFLSGLQHPLNPGSQNAAKLASAPIPTSKSTRSRVAARGKIPKSAGIRN